MPLSDKIQAQISEFFADPLSWPREARAYIPRLVEQAGISVTTSQITDIYTTSNTVSGLGPGKHGRMGMVRAGASPYDYIRLTYDSEVGRWIGDPMVGSVMHSWEITDAATGEFRTTSTSNVVNTKGSSLMLPWDAYVDAGLNYQTRFLGFIGYDGAGTVGHVITATTHIYGWTVGGTGSGLSQFKYPLTYTVAGSPVAAFQDGGWTDLTGATVTDLIEFGTGLKTSNAGTTAMLRDATVLVRLVSA